MRINLPTAARWEAPDANAHPEEHIGRRRAVPPANDTDPASHCNPEGLTRALLYPDPIEFIQLPDRILQHFQWRYYIRTIWLDGRPPFKDPDQLRWWGYSTGHWEGDTLVVESDGVDPRHGWIILGTRTAMRCMFRNVTSV